MSTAGMSTVEASALNASVLVLNRHYMAIHVVDVKDAPVESIVRLLVELGGRQVVFDPGLDCALTLKLHEVRWVQTLETTLSACGI